jgi:nucleotide-binding universal stress UspA family protein
VYTKILVAYNDSPGARAALDRAEALAGALGAALTLVRSVSEAPLMEAAKPETIASGRTDLEREIDRDRPELDAELWVVGGPASEAILAAAVEMEADLVVTGSRHRGAIARTVLGSVSSDLVHQAHCDILVVHPTED